MKTAKGKFAAIAALAALFFAVRVFSACPGDPTGTGTWYSTAAPSINITYNSVTGKIYSTGDYGMGQVMQLTFGATSTIHYNSLPYDIVTNQTTGTMYASLRQGDAVKVFTSAGAVVTTISTGGTPMGMAISTLKKRLYVANASTNNVTVIDIDPASPGYHRVIKTIAAGTNPMDVTVDDDAAYGLVYVSNREGRSLSVISESQLKVVGIVPLSFKPGEVAASNSTHKIYVVNTEGNYVAVVNGNSLPSPVQTTFSVGSDPWGVAVNPNTNRVFVTDYTDKTVKIVDQVTPPNGIVYTTTQTDTFLSPIRGIYVNPATDNYYAASNGGYSTNGLPGCNRKYLDACIEMRSLGTATDADVQTFLECYFQQN